MSEPIPTWRIVLAAILDFLTVFFVGGYAIAALTGNLTPNGFSLHGWSGLAFLVLIVAYFVIGKRVGGTLWKRILRAVR